MVSAQTPLSIFLGNKDIIAHEKEVEQLTKLVNESLKLLPNAKSDRVHILIGDNFARSTVMEVVYKFRMAGWDVAYFINEYYPNGISIGLFYRNNE